MTCVHEDLELSDKEGSIFQVLLPHRITDGALLQDNFFGNLGRTSIFHA